MRRSVPIIICLTIFLWLCSDAQVIEADSLALVAIYDSTQGQDWTNQENWLSGPVAQWEGVTVDEGRVTGLNFNLGNLQGSIPDVVFDLDGLVSVAIRENLASLHFDSRMQAWTNLEIISISGGMMTGDIDALCGMPALKQITFFNCNLGGLIPECLQTFALTRLNLSNAALDTSELPAFLAEIETLDNISLAQNAFIGQIPMVYCTDRIRFLNLGKNQLTGEIPACLNMGDQLVQLFLNNNDMSGEVPSEIFGSSLTILDLGGNAFEGDIEEWPILVNVSRLELDDNAFSGTFDASVLASDNFRILDISKNQFDGIIDFPVLPLMNTLRVNENQFDFNDLEALIPGNSNFIYASQSEIGIEEDIEVKPGDKITLEMEAGGSITQYQWRKDGEIIDGATSSQLVIESFAPDDAGLYICEAIHDSFPALTLVRKPKELRPLTTSTSDIYTDKWRLASNPVTHSLHMIRTDSDQSSPAMRVFLHDFSGHELLTVKMHQTSNDISLDMFHFAPGEYVVSLISDAGFGVWKVLKL